MKNCYLCNKPIIWQKKTSINNCTKHYFHCSCQPVGNSCNGRCPPCIEYDTNLFLQQETEHGARATYKKYFNIENLLEKTLSLNKIFLFKYLVKKINTHTFLVQCATNNNITMFENVVKHSSINLFSTHNGKTLLEDLENKDPLFKQTILEKAKIYQKVTPSSKPTPPPIPIRPKRPKRPNRVVPLEKHTSSVQPSAPPLDEITPKPPPSYEEVLGDSLNKDGYKNIYPNLSILISLNGKMV